MRLLLLLLETLEFNYKLINKGDVMKIKTNVKSGHEIVIIIVKNIRV